MLNKKGKTILANSAESASEVKAEMANETQANGEVKAVSANETQSASEVKAEMANETQANGEVKAGSANETQSNGEVKAVSANETQANGEGQGESTNETQSNGEVKAVSANETKSNDEVKEGSKSDKVKAKIKYLAKRWFIDAFSGMALGLFATLIAGTIIEQVGVLIGANMVGNFFRKLGDGAKILMGAGIGAGIAHALKADKLTTFSCIVAGFLGANSDKLFVVDSLKLLGGIGNPICAYMTALISCEVVSLYAGKTKFDIIIVPLGTILVTALVAITLCPPISWLIKALSDGIAIATAWSPFLMGIVISLVMGILLTMPTSSAAIWVSIALGNSSPAMMLAGGAAVVGCACQMVGFAVMSYKENKVAGLISQGLGTSMLQIPNIFRHPQLMIPPCVASIIAGPLATCVFSLKCGATGGGMGTSGLVGVISTIEASAGINPILMWSGIILLFFVLPAVVCSLMGWWMRRKGWIHDGDLAI